MSTIRIEPYQQKFEEAHIGFAKRHWSKKRRAIPEYIYWKFRGDRSDELWSLLLLLDQDKVIGQLGLIPCVANIAGHEVDAQWACDMMLDPDYRGRNLGTNLWEYALSLRPVTLGSNPSIGASKSAMKAGYKNIYGPYKMIFPINIRETLRLKYKSIRYLNVKNPLIYYLHNLSRREIKEVKNASLADIETRIFNMRKGINMPYILHDASFLNWRGKAFESYYREPGLIAHNDGVSYLCYSKMGNHLRIFEFNATDHLKLAAMVQYMLNTSFNDEVAFISVFANTHSDRIMLMRIGFIKSSKRRVHIVYGGKDEIEDKIAKAESFYYTFWDSDEYL
jgi:GNAT superfamily N-acetyltransferase